MIIEYLLFLIVVIVIAVASIITKKLTVAGGITGAVLAILIYFGVGFPGIIMLGLFFLLGTLATSWKKAIKAKLLVMHKDSSQRNAGQVLANGGVAGLISIVAIGYPQLEALWLLMIAGSFSAALADTLSSELGTVYGKQFYNVLSLKKDQKGLDGVVSIEGLLFGMGGSSIIASVYSLNAGWGSGFWILLVGGTIGNLSDSILGAALERKGIIKNDAVNFLNTLIGAIVVLGFEAVLFW